MAEQLYVQMLAVQSDVEAAQDTGDTPFHPAPATAFVSLQQLAPDDMEAALDVLLISAWDAPLEQVRASREELATALHLEIKTRRVARVLPGTGVAGLPAKANDQESYQSLLDDAARGGGY